MKWQRQVAFLAILIVAFFASRYLLVDQFGVMGRETHFTVAFVGYLVSMALFRWFGSERRSLDEWSKTETSSDGPGRAGGSG